MKNTCKLLNYVYLLIPLRSNYIFYSSQRSRRHDLTQHQWTAHGRRVTTHPPSEIFPWIITDENWYNGRPTATACWHPLWTQGLSLVVVSSYWVNRLFSFRLILRGYGSIFNVSGFSCSSFMIANALRSLEIRWPPCVCVFVKLINIDFTSWLMNHNSLSLSFFFHGNTSTSFISVFPSVSHSHLSFPH